MIRPIIISLLAAAATASAAEPLLRQPGYRPKAPALQAIRGAAVFTNPTNKIENATIVIRDNVIESVGANTEVPAGARVWNFTNRVIYPAFIDPAVTLRSTNTVRGKIDEATHFYGLENRFADKPALEASRITPHRRALEGYAPEEKELKALRELGFGAGNVLPGAGIIRGTSGVTLFGDDQPNAGILRDNTFQVVSFDTDGGRENSYPRSLMGVIATIRQTLYDARQLNVQPGSDFDPALVALTNVVANRTPLLIEPRSSLMVDRATRIAKEFSLDFAILASGNEWRRPELAAAAKVPFIVPLDFPEVPKLPDEDDWATVSLDNLRAWDWAAENPAVLKQQGLTIALTTHGLGDKKNFRKNLRLAVDRGLSEADALAALTTTPAGILGISDRLGTIEQGKIANLTVVENDGLFNTTNKITDLWVAGERFHLAESKPKKEEPKETDAAKKEEEEKKAAERRELMIKRLAKSAQDGRGPLASPKVIFVKNATIWTSAREGRLENASAIFEDGLVKAIGKDLAAPEGAHVIDGEGKHLTPGLIDCHSHAMVLHGVNEGTLPSSAMCRIGDVVNSETRNIHMELAGGLTVANLLHGSANPIGGQNCVIKLRDGAAPEDLKFKAAPEGIKFALGENVKQSNWGENSRFRFPQSRMGVPVFMRNRFQAARAYAEALRSGKDLRRDLELEALAEIIDGTRLVHCHSYRQDEIVAFLRAMEDFGVRVATLQHVLEGYKVADEIARHGAGASCFSDWWSYKIEVIDAIPYAGSLMRDRGVVVSFNSDSSDLSRRLYAEAAKAVKYGNTPEVEALKFVTINPARQLRIDSRVGSLEPGKDADFVLWSKSPLDATTVCLETWIEGKKYFDRTAVPAIAEAREKEREALIAKAKKVIGNKGGDSALNAAEEAFFNPPLELLYEHEVRHCDDE